MEYFDSVVQLLKVKLLSWFNTLVLLIPNAVIAISILVVFFVLSSVISKYFKIMFGKYSNNDALISFFSIIVRVVVFAVGVLVAIHFMHLDKIVISFLAGAGFLGIALGFAFQDMATNLISGIALVLKKDYPFKEGDLIETNGFKGNVEKINLRSTLVKTFQGQFILIPNKLIFENPLINYNMQKERRVDIVIGVSYAEDLEKVKQVTINAVNSVPFKVQDKDVEVFYEEFSDSSINFQLRFWVTYTDKNEYLISRSEAITRVKKAFNENDITIPFPIRTLDFGIKGGKELSQMKNN